MKNVISGNTDVLANKCWFIARFDALQQTFRFYEPIQSISDRQLQFNN